jgi:hypothetical protein
MPVRRIEYQKHGLPYAHILFWTNFHTRDIAAVESVIHVSCPKESPIAQEGQMAQDFRILIDTCQKQKDMTRC